MAFPTFAPDLQLLFKSKTVRPKDAVDAEQAIPELGDEHRARLSRLLDPDHEWQRRLR